MADLKTKPNDEDIEKFIESVDDLQKKKDAYAVMQMMRNISGEDPKLWGNSMVGFGSYHYKYESGREGDWFLTGFSPRKNALTLYIMAGFEQYENLLEKLGKYKTGKSCLYVKKLEDIDQEVLKELIKLSVEHMRSRY
ncbi:MAG: DUF1801 domain-containing protein [Candidatus Cyclobacteriaceae bacterium M2_1C_046]